MEGRQARRSAPPPGEAVQQPVSYSEVKFEVREGDILCFSGAGFLSAAIRKLTKSQYSHVGLVYLFEGRRYCLEAVGSGVRLVLLSELVRRYDGGIDYFEMLNVTPDQRRQAISFGFQQLGKLYDKDGILRFLWYVLTGRKRRVALDDNWFCSEMVAQAYSRQGLALCSRSVTYTSPNDIALSERVAYCYTIKNS